jgi:hypothetical protein
MKVRKLTVHPILNITWHVRPFASTTTTIIAPAQDRGIGGNARRHPRHWCVYDTPFRAAYLSWSQNSHRDKSSIDTSTQNHAGIGRAIFHSVWQGYFFGKLF